MSGVSPKILHFCYSGHIQAGILKQLQAEYDASIRLGLAWTIVYFTHEKSTLPFVHSTGLASHLGGIAGKAYRYFMLRICAAKWLFNNRKNFDIVLLRYVVGDMFIAVNSLIAKNYYTVHHTKELEEAAHLGRYVSKYSLAVEKALGNVVIRNASGIIAVTQEILDYERVRSSIGRARVSQPHHVYSNGLDFSRCALADDLRGGVPKFLFVASAFQPWHGLDLLLDAMSSCNELFELHLIGDTGDLSIDDPRVIFHGSLLDAEILDIAANMDIGIGSLGMFRNQLNEATTLKVREYFASGLPVYATHRDAGLPRDFPYFYFHETLEVKDILAAAVVARNYSRTTIRNSAERYLSKLERLRLLSSQLVSGFRK